jgi:hypothetical protein
MMNLEVTRNWCASCSFTSGMSCCIVWSFLYRFLINWIFNGMMTSQEGRCCQKFSYCEYHCWFILIFFISVILCMRMQRPYSHMYWKYEREIIVSSGDVLWKDVKFQTLFYVHALFMYLLAALSKDILIGNKNIVIISHHSQHVLLFNIFISCLLGSFTEHIQWHGSVFALHTRLGTWGTCSTFCKSTELFFVMYNCL